jgi:hypothetical protein
MPTSSDPLRARAHVRRALVFSLHHAHISLAHATTLLAATSSPPPDFFTAPAS